MFVQGMAALAMVALAMDALLTQVTAQAMVARVMAVCSITATRHTLVEPTVARGMVALHTQAVAQAMGVQDTAALPMVVRGIHNLAKPAILSTLESYSLLQQR